MGEKPDEICSTTKQESVRLPRKVASERTSQPKIGMFYGGDSLRHFADFQSIRLFIVHSHPIHSLV
jgi:hypothetical protein